jgi:hypothetical protein
LLTAHRRLITADAIQAGILRVEHYGKMGWNNAVCALNGHLHLPALRTALDQTVATTVTPTKEDAA